MSSPLRQQIEDMEPRRYARAAKRAAELAKELAEQAGTEVSARILHLAEATEDEIAAERAQQLEAQQRPDPPSGAPEGGETAPTVHGQSMPNVPFGVMLPALVNTGSFQQFLADTKSPTLADLVPKMSQGTQEALNAIALSDLYRSSETAMASLLHRSPFETGLWLAHAVGESPTIPGKPGGRLPSRADWEDFFAEVPKLEKGHFVSADDETWRAGWLIEGALSVSVTGHRPWETPLEDDDVVRVDPQHGLMLVETHQSTHGRKMKNGVAVVLRISPTAVPHVNILQWLPPARDEESKSPYYKAP